jgi:hypothetical protein
MSWSRLVFCLRAVWTCMDNSAWLMPFSGHNSWDQLTKQLSHCFSIITNDLDTSHEWFGMVLKGINGLFVMKQTGFLLKGSMDNYRPVLRSQSTLIIYVPYVSTLYLLLIATYLHASHRRCSYFNSSDKWTQVLDQRTCQTLYISVRHNLSNVWN